MKVYRQATLILLTDKGEVGRLVAETSPTGIAGLFDKAPDRPADAGSCSPTS